MNITDKLARLLGQATPMLKSFHASNTDALAAAAQNALAEYEAALAKPASGDGPKYSWGADGTVLADFTADPGYWTTPSQPGSSVQERRLAPWPDYAGNPIYEGDTIKHPADGTTGVVFVLANETDDHDRWRVLYNGDATPARASRLCLQIDYKGQAVVAPPAPAAEQGDPSPSAAESDKTWRFFQPPFQVIEENDTYYVTDSSTACPMRVMLMWPAHDPEDTEAAEIETWRLGEVFARAANAALTPPAATQPEARGVEGKVIEPCVDSRGHFWRPVDGRTSQCTSCYVCASDDDFKATAIATRAE